MFIVLDNAEYILDPQGIDAQNIYGVVEELSRFKNISLCITSRISMVPPHCNRLTIPALSMEAACDVFFSIYNESERSDTIRELIRQLDFHALSITLLATTAAQNMWEDDRLAKEWGVHRAQVLRTDRDESLEAAIELSLASPTFRNLNPVAREVLGVIAFFPQGISENNLDWLFPAISNITGILDKFGALSLTYRRADFVTMLAPLRDYLGPRDPRTSPLLCATKDRYFRRLRLLGDLEPDQPGFGETQWIRSEDVNVEYLLNVFTSFDADSNDVWDTCAGFVAHLYWHKRRFTVLGPRIEGLPDNHHSKPQGLYDLSRLLESLGHHAEQKRLLTHTLELERGQGNDHRVARTLWRLADTNRLLGLYEEGIQQSREALEIHEQLHDAEGQGKCWNFLGWLLLDDEQLGAAEEAGSRAIKLFLDQGREYWVCLSHRLLGDIYQAKGEPGKAVQHFEAAIGIASPFDWHYPLFWIHHSLAMLYLGEEKLGNAQFHIERAKSHAIDDTFKRGCAMEWQAWIWYQQGRIEEAEAEAQRALDTYEKLGATRQLEQCRKSLRWYDSK